MAVCSRFLFFDLRTLVNYHTSVPLYGFDPITALSTIDSASYLLCGHRDPLIPESLGSR